MTTYSGAPTSLFALLTAGIAAVDLNTIQPPTDKDERPLDGPIIGVATDHMKRIYVFHANLADECNALLEEATKLSVELMGADLEKGKLPKSVSSWFRSMLDFSGGRRDKIARLEAIEQELPSKKALTDLAAELFWAEVRHHFPDAPPHIILYRDWTIGACEEDDQEDILERMLRGSRGRTPRSMREFFRQGEELAA